MPAGQVKLLKDTNTHKKWKVIRERAGLPNLRFHDLRFQNLRSVFSNALKQKDVPLSVVQSHLEHSSTDLTQRTTTESGKVKEQPKEAQPQGDAGQGETDIPDYRELAKVPVSELIKKYGEGHTLEFKETLEYATQNKGKNKDILLSSLKTIAGFLNAEGGTLLIGVDDSGKIKGIERDLSALRHGNNDRFEQKIRNFLRERFRPQPIRKIDISFEKLPQGTVCRVDVQASKDIIHLDNKVYVRDGNTTQLLDGRALTDWIQERKRTQ